MYIKSQSGFTIVELIISTFVIGILTVALNSISVSHGRLSQRARDNVVLNSFVEGEYEALRSSGFLRLDDGITDITNNLPDELNNPRSGSREISSPTPGLKQIDYTITYNDQGRPQTFTYRSYIGELGVAQ